MISDNMIKLFNELGFSVKLENEEFKIINQMTNESMTITNKTGNILAEGENGYIFFGFNCPIMDNKRIKEGYSAILGQLTIENNKKNEFLKVGCYGNGLLISNYNVIYDNNEKKINSYSLLINNNGTLSINLLNNSLAYIIWNRNELLTNVDDNIILDIFTDEKILAIVEYYSNIYPEMMEGVVELTQNIISKTQDNVYTRKLIK